MTVVKWDDLQEPQQAQQTGAVSWDSLQAPAEPTPIDPAPVEPETPQEPGFMEKLDSVLSGVPSYLKPAPLAVRDLWEPAATVATSIPAEIAAGYGGATMAALEGPQAGDDAVTGIRKAMTYEPRTRAGQEALAKLGEYAQMGIQAVRYPISGLMGLTELATGQGLEQAAQTVEQAQQEGIAPTAGQRVLEETGSPLAAAATETAIMGVPEVLGFRGGRAIAKTRTGLEGAPKKPITPAKISDKTISKKLIEAAPETRQIKDASRAIYKEIDDLNVSVKPISAQSMIHKVIKRATDEGVDATLTPKSARVVQQFQDELMNANPRSLSDLEKMRRKAQMAAEAIDKTDARIGAIMIDEIDDFMDNLTAKSFAGADAKTASKVSVRYQEARSLWGRAKRSEVIQDIFDAADLQASGLENGLRVKLRQLLNNKKRVKYFTPDEQDAMRAVVKGTGTSNILKMVGRLGFSEGGATNVLSSLVGAGLMGPAAPALGQVSKKLAQVTTMEAARKIEALVRGGAKGRDITKAYLQSVPKGKRNIADLSDMLLLADTELDDLLKHSNRMVKEAAETAKARQLFHRAETAGALAPAATIEEE